jgi:hypothetical protein
MSANTRKLLGGVIVSAAALASPGANASTTLNYQGAAYPSYQSGYIQYNDGPGGYPDSTKNVYVGGFNVLNTSTNQSLIAWCVDIFDTVHNATYNNGDTASINNFDKLQQLISQSYSKVNNATSSAAFQLAVWEIVNEQFQSRLWPVQGLRWQFEQCGYFGQ